MQDIEFIVNIVGVCVNIIAVVLTVITLKDKNISSGIDASINVSQNYSPTINKDNINSFNKSVTHNYYSTNPGSGDTWSPIIFIVIIGLAIGIFFEPYISLLFLACSVLGFIVIFMYANKSIVVLPASARWKTCLFISEPLINIILYSVADSLLKEVLNNTELPFNPLIGKFVYPFSVAIAVVECVILLIVQLCVILIPRIKLEWINNFMIKLLRLWYIPPVIACLGVLYALMMCQV